MQRRSTALAAVALAALAIAGCGGSHAISLPCAPEPHGHLCLKVSRDGNGKVTDVIAYFSASASPLTGKKWRLALTYGQSGIYPGRTRHGNPPRETYCKDAHGDTATTGNGCDDTLAADYASLGDFAGFSVPRASLPDEPTCVQEQVMENGKWIAGPPKPACAG